MGRSIVESYSNRESTTTWVGVCDRTGCSEASESAYSLQPGVFWVGEAAVRSDTACSLQPGTFYVGEAARQVRPT